MAVFAATRRKSGNHGVLQPWKHAFALAAIIQCVFSEGFRQRITRGGGYGRDTESRPESLTISLRSLFPLRRSIFPLAQASRKSCAYDWIRAECVEEVVVEFCFRCRTHVAKIWLWGRRGLYPHTWTDRVIRIGQRLRPCHR